MCWFVNSWVHLFIPFKFTRSMVHRFNWFTHWVAGSLDERPLFHWFIGSTGSVTGTGALVQPVHRFNWFKLTR